MVYQDGLYGAEVYVSVSTLLTRFFFKTNKLLCCVVLVFMLFNFIWCRAAILQLIEWLNQHLLPRQPTAMGKQTNATHDLFLAATF